MTSGIAAAIIVAALAVRELKLSPAAGDVLRVVVVGDIGSGTAEVAAGIAALHRQRKIDAMLVPGDNIYPCGVTSEKDPRWSVVAPLAAAGIPRTCPSPRPSATSSRHRRRDGASSSAITRSSRPATTTLLRPLRAAKVDLYVCGHDHHQELIEGKPRHLISGAGSEPVPPLLLHRATLYPEKIGRERKGFAMLEITARQLRVRFYDAAGRPRTRARFVILGVARDLGGVSARCTRNQTVPIPRPGPGLRPG